MGYYSLVKPDPRIGRADTDIVVDKRYGNLGVALLLLTSLPAQPILADAALQDLIEISSTHLQVRPDSFTALLNRAKCYLRLNQNALALNDIKTAEGFSDDIETAYLLGEYFVAEKQYQNAVLAFSKYLTRYPAHTPSIHGRAIANNRLDLTDRSIRDYQHLLSVSKNHSRITIPDLSWLEASIEPYGIYMEHKTLDRGMENLGLLASLQILAIELEIRKNDFKQALARHEILKPWLGNMPRRKNRHRQISEKLSAETIKKDSSN